MPLKRGWDRASLFQLSWFIAVINNEIMLLTTAIKIGRTELYIVL
jgi:hypothetical protein